MGIPQNTNGRSTSTTWGTKRVKIASAPPGHSRSTAKPSRWHGLPRWAGSEKLTLTVTYRGGAECWYSVQARGRQGMFPGYVSLHDALHEIYRQES